MVLSDCATWRGYTISAVVECLLLEDEIKVSKQDARQFLKQYKNYGTIARKPGSGLASQLSPVNQRIIEQAMREDDETTATQLQAKLADYGMYVSLAIILQNRRLLGWVYRGSAYCQLIHSVTKEKRLEWACSHLDDTFDDVIWTDETSVQLEAHRCFCYRKEGISPGQKHILNIP